MADKLAVDYSTINMDALSKLPVFKCPPTYRLQDGLGNGCFLDPPGYPTYFTKSVYTQHGNSPRRGAELVIRDPVHQVWRIVQSSNDWDGCTSWDEMRAKVDLRISLLYKPLALNHPRVQEWMAYLFAYFHTCYIDPNAAPHSQDRTVIYPVPYYKLKHFHDDPRFSDEWRKRERAAVEQANAEIIEQTRKIATPDNHSAVRLIREHYPDFQPEHLLADAPPSQITGLPFDVDSLLKYGLTFRPKAYNWFERLPHKPAPDECPGEAWGKHEGQHPVNGSWCQVCGWQKRAEEKVTA